MLIDGDRAVLATAVVSALMRHEAGHTKHAVLVAFLAGRIAQDLLDGRSTRVSFAAWRKQLVEVFESGLIERDRLAARALIAVIDNAPGAASRLAQLEAA